MSNRETRIHFCQDGPFLVGPSGDEDYFTEDPYVYTGVSSETVVGCNRLRCKDCGEMVRFETKPETIHFRLYECGCRKHECWGRLDHVNAIPDSNPYSDQVYSLPWVCAGHPIHELPFQFEGTEISERQDFEALVKGVLAGRMPRRKTRGPEKQPLEWLLRLYSLVLDTGIEDRLGRAVGTCLVDPNRRVRARAVEFFIEWPFAHGWEALVDAVERHLDLYLAVPDEEADDEVPDPKFGTLEGRLLLAFYDHLMDPDGVVRSQRALNLAKSVALRMKFASFFFEKYFAAAPEWVLENLEPLLRVGAGDKNYLKRLLDACPSRHVAEMSRRLLRIPGMNPEVVRDFILGHQYSEDLRPRAPKLLRQLGLDR